MTTPFERRVQRLRKHILRGEEMKVNITKVRENYDTGEVEENKVTEQPTKEDKKDTGTIGIDTMTKAEIIEILSERGISYNPRDKKEDLYELLLGSE